MKVADEGMSSVRGVAALVVVAAHAVQIFLIRLLGLDHVIAKMAAQMAVHAVFVFFIVSGYLITISIIKNCQRNGGGFNLIEYTSARISRIYPPLIFAIAICSVLYLLIRLFELPGNDLSGGSPYGLPNDLYTARNTFTIKSDDIINALLMNNGLLQVDGPLWSLCVEWRIYIAVACLAMLIATKKNIYRILWGGIFILSLTKLKAIDGNAFFYLTIWLTGGGVAIGHAFKFRFDARIRRIIGVGLVSVIGIIVYFNPEILLASRRLSNNQERAFQFLWCILWLCILFPWVDYDKTFFRRTLIGLGGFSYTLFIIHFPVMLFLMSLLQNIIGYSIALAILAAALSMGIVLFLSYFAGKYIERKDLITPIVRFCFQRFAFLLRGIVISCLKK